MRDKRRAEQIVYAIGSVLTVVAVGLTLAALLLPYWFTMEYEGVDTNGPVTVKVDVGLYQDRVCWGNDNGCSNYWRDDDDYNSVVNMPSEDKIRAFETAGVVFGILTLLSLIPLWLCHQCWHSEEIYRTASFVLFFALSMLAGFLCLVGCLILAAKVDDDIDWAPLLSVIGGALFLMSGIMGCVLFRYDPSYGTVGNPVSPDTYRQFSNL